MHERYGEEEASGYCGSFEIHFGKKGSGAERGLEPDFGSCARGSRPSERIAGRPSRERLRVVICYTCLSAADTLAITARRQLSALC